MSVSGNKYDYEYEIESFVCVHRYFIKIFAQKLNTLQNIEQTLDFD